MNIKLKTSVENEQIIKKDNCVCQHCESIKLQESESEKMWISLQKVFDK